MAREKRQSDELYNIRRRYNRQAARYDKQASGAENSFMAAFYKSAAESLRKKSNSLYSKSIKQAVSQQIRDSFSKDNSTGTKLNGKISKAISDAIKAAEKEQKAFRNLDSTEQLTKAALSGPAGKLFYAYTSKLWQGKPYSERDATIMEIFGGNNIIEAAENFVNETGIDIFDTTDIDFDRFYEQNKRKSLLKVNSAIYRVMYS